MKRLLILFLILTLTLTSCVTVMKTKETLSENKAPIEENEIVEENPNEITEETDVETPEETPEETVEEESNTPITPSENETEAIISEFDEISESDLEALLQGISGETPVEFPPVPIG